MSHTHTYTTDFSFLTEMLIINVMFQENYFSLSQLEHRVWNYNTKIVIFNHFAL